MNKGTHFFKATWLDTVIYGLGIQHKNKVKQTYTKSINSYKNKIMFLSPGSEVNSIRCCEDEDSVRTRSGRKTAIKSRALPVHTLLAPFLVLLFGDPHLLEGS